MNLSSFSLNTELQPVIVRWRANGSDSGDLPATAVNALQHAAQEWPGRDLLLLAEDTEFDQSGIELLRACHGRDQLDVVSVTGRAAATSLLSAQPAEDLAGLFWNYGAHAALACERINWHCSLWYAHSAVRDIAAEIEKGSLRKAVLGCVVSDEGQDTIPINENPALQHLHAGISHAADRGLPLERRPYAPRRVILHVLHSWGGGIETFVRQQALADSLSTHLVFVAAGSWQSRQYGQRLFLYADLDAQPLCQWRLRTAINSTATSHAEYQQILDEIIDEWAVAEIRVSSLIGHSLDVLRTATPTVLCSHDLYPLWPILHDPSPANELNLCKMQVSIDEHRAKFSFSEIQAKFWINLSNELCNELISRNIPIVHPSVSIRSYWQQLQPKLCGANWLHVAHAKPNFTWNASPAQLSMTEPLRVVVPGRISGVKGEHLLCKVIPQMSDSVHWLLLGCGNTGSSFEHFKQVSTIADYSQANLPELVQAFRPHLALLPSMAAESWGYVLSEMIALGIPVLATESGAYPERLSRDISRAQNSVVKPNAEAICSYLQAVLSGRQKLEAVDLCLAGIEQQRHLQQWQMIHNCAMRAPRFRVGNAEQSFNRLCRAEALQMIFAAAHAGHNLQQLYAKTDEQAQQIFHQGQRLLGSISSLLRIIGDFCDRPFAAALKIEHEADIDPQLELASDLMRMQKKTHQQSSSELIAAKEHVVALISEKQLLQGQIDAAQSQLTDSQEKLAKSYRLYDTDTTDLARQRDTALKQRDILIKLNYSPLAQLIRSVLSGYRKLRNVGRHTALATKYQFQRLRTLSVRGFHSLRTRGFVNTFKRVSQTYRQNTENTRSSSASINTELNFSQSSHPTASIIIPAFNNLNLTIGCLRSLIISQDKTAFEVIVVDDASTDSSGTTLPQIEGIQYVLNSCNSGFIASCNAGAAIAKGTYLVFLNNDTQVKPGWLDELLKTFEQHPDTGLAGSKLIYADGRLQESGGIVFCDGSGWNYGRFEDADNPMYNFVREVDYCSGAALAISRTLFVELGGFDSYYAPAYYEDTDLAMKVRDRGLKVRVQPSSEVIHFEGSSSGTDLQQGTKRFQRLNQEKFHSRWADTLRKQPPPGTDEITARNHRSRRSVLVIDDRTPTPDRDSGSLRMFEILRLLCKEGCAVSFFAENSRGDNHYNQQLRDLGVEVWTKPYLRSIPDWLKQHGKRFQTIVVSRHYIFSPLLPLIKAYAPKAKLVFDTVDLHYLREEREAQQLNDPALIKKAKESKRSELRLMREADVTWVVSPVERALLAKEVPQAHVEVMSNIHHVRGPGPDFSSRHDIVFVGGYRHPPNVDAMIWFAQEVWPEIHSADPGIKLHVVGSDTPESIKELHGKRGIVVHGFVADLTPLLDACRVSIAPLRYGAGVKGKINQALSLGLPVVGTTCAVEGMGLHNERDVMIADSAADFAQCVLRLHSDPTLWKRLADAGLLNTKEKFSDEVARRALLNTFNALTA